MLDPTQVLRLFFFYTVGIAANATQIRKLMSYICRLFITDSINKINFSLELVIFGYWTVPDLNTE